MYRSIASGIPDNFLYIPPIRAYVSVVDLTAWRGYYEVLGFWRDPSSGGAIPENFDGFDSDKCPIQVVIQVPLLS